MRRRYSNGRRRRRRRRRMMMLVLLVLLKRRGRVLIGHVLGGPMQRRWPRFEDGVEVQPVPLQAFGRFGLGLGMIIHHPYTGRACVRFGHVPRLRVSRGAADASCKSHSAERQT